MPNKAKTEQTSTSEAQEDINLEASLNELEQIVEKLEQGDLALENALAEFERGIALTRRAQTALSAAEQKVKRLVEADGKQALVDFSPSDAE